MPSTSRRLARTQSSDAEQGKTGRSALPTAAKLSTVLEREETPKCGTKSNLTALMSPSPLYPVLQTPRSTTGISPSFEEAHPSKVQRSTAKQLDTGLLFGFVNVNAGNVRHDETPTKSNCVPPPDFEFHFSRPQPGLGPEAQRMMDELRGEASQIKKRLEAERDAERAKNGEQGNSSLMGVGGRRIAPAKGKSGRFSDVHLAEFRKMDSIVGHPSAFRAQPGRFTPATTSLKRTKSQAKLDDTHDGSAKMKPFRKGGEDEDGDTSQAKRVKTHINEDTSTTPQKIPPKVRAIGPPTTPSIPRSKSVKRPAFTRTPTASLKSLKHITFAGLKPVLQGQESAAPGSTLHNETSIHHTAKNSLNEDHPSLPSSPTPGLTRTTTVKRVAFTSDANLNLESVSPYPASKVIPKSRLPTSICYPTLPKLPPPCDIRASQLHGPGVFTFRTEKKLELGSVGASTIRQVVPSGSNDDLVETGGEHHLPVIPHGIPNKKRRYDETSSDDEPTKKISRGVAQWTPTLHQKTKEEQKTRSKMLRTDAAGGKRKGVLSLSRLNVLATPKKKKVSEDGPGGNGQKAKPFWRT